MSLLIFILVYWILNFFIFYPALWFCFGKLLNVQELTAKKAYHAYFITVLIVICIGIFISIPLALLSFPEFLSNVLSGLIAISVSLWIIKRKFQTTIYKAAGVFFFTLLVMLFFALFIRTFIAQGYHNPAGSMKDTLLVGDKILVNKYIYGIKLPFTDLTILPLAEPHYGDIIVFKYPKDPKIDFLKRVVGKPGDKIEMKGTEVFRNGIPLDESYAKYSSNTNRMGRVHDFQVQIPEKSYFVLGDNRDNSQDSRYWGFVPEEYVKGKVVAIYFSIDPRTNKPRFDRIGDISRH